MKRIAAMIIITWFVVCSGFTLTPHINKGKLEELSLEQAKIQLGLTEIELREINEEYFGRVAFEDNYPLGQEVLLEEKLSIFKQTFAETNEVLYRVLFKTKTNVYYKKTENYFQKIYYVSENSKPNLIFADFYFGEINLLYNTIGNYTIRTNLMPVIKENKIAGIMIYGIETYIKEGRFDSDTNEFVFNHKACVFWSDSFSTKNLRNEYGNDPDIWIECSRPLIDDKDCFKYTIQNAFDKNPATSYVEDTEDDLIVLYIEFYKEIFNGAIKHGQPQTISKIKIINGYAANESLYFDNNRIKTFDFVGLDINTSKEKEPVYKKLWDSYEGLVFPESMNYFIFKIEELSFNSFTIKFNSIYKGSKYSDTCLSEIDFLVNKSQWFFGE